MKGERQGHTLSPTALVNEAYLRLYSEEERNGQTHRSFYSSAARGMRQILVDYARGKKADKRGGGISAITLNEQQHAAAEINLDILELNTALEKLATIDQEKVSIVEMRYFAGMTLDEVATELDISIATVKRKWTTARAWLFRELTN